MAVIIENRFIENTEFTNNTFEPDIGIVSGSIVVNFIDGGNGRYRFDITVKDNNNVIVITQTLTGRTAGSDGGIITIPFFDSFQMGNDIPPFVTINAKMTLINPNAPDVLILNVTSEEIPFTGTTTEEPDPKPDMVDLVVVPKSFTNSRLEFEIRATKTNSFPFEFDNRDLKFIIQIRDLSNTILQLGEIPFQFGSNPTFIKNNILTRAYPDEIKLEVFTQTLERAFISNKVTLNLQVEALPGECPIGTHLENGVCVSDEPPVLSSTDFLVSFSNEQPTKFYTLSNEELILLKADVAQCASITDETPSNSVSMGLAFVQNDIIMICQGTEPPLPDPLNVCFTLLYRDNTEDTYSLTSSEFDDLVANPVSTGICSPVIKNISDCSTPSSTLGTVRADIFNKVAICLETPPEDDIKLGMVLQSPTGFRIENNRLIGQIGFIATESFNEFWFGKDITSITQIKDKFGAVIQMKENRLNFTQTERDELINIDSSASDQTDLIVEFFVIVSLADLRRFAESIQLTVTQEGQTEPTNGNGGLKFGSGGVLSKITGGFFGLLALCLLTEKGRK